MSLPLHRNVLAQRQQRMDRFSRQHRTNVNVTRSMIFDAARANVEGRLSFDELVYLRFLCGYSTDEPNTLDVRRKAYVGNLFERACVKRRTRINMHPIDERHEVLPGIRAVPRNRDRVLEIQSAEGKRKRARRG